MKLDDSTVEIREDKQSGASEEAAARSEVESKVQPTKPRSRIPSMEEFVQGILRSSSPIPPVKDETPELKTEEFAKLQETPILSYSPVKQGVDFTILDSDVTKSVRPASQGRAKIAEAKVSRTKGSPDSAYQSAGSPAASTPAGPPAQTQKEDIYMKLARAELHEQIKKYSTWRAENLRSISTKVCSMLLTALQKPSLDCQTTQLMIKIYESCLAGPATKELDTIVVSIFDLLDEQIHVERISVLEEYVVMKYCKKMVQ